MTKAELISKVHQQFDDDLMTKRAVTELVDLTFEEIRKSVKREKRFSMTGFGTFNVRLRKSRMGTNPMTGQPIKIAASKTVTFKPAPVFKKGL